MESSPLPIIDPKTTSLKNYSPNLAEFCEELYYRQSMLKDYLTCPNMMLYRWILGQEEEDSFFAGILGTAGHEVIREMHDTKATINFRYTFQQILEMFCEYFTKALNSSKVPPKISKHHATITAQLNAVAPEYVRMLQGYQKDCVKHEFHVTVAEQPFALELKDEFGRTFVFTGVIDQAGFYTDGAFALRDIKFRADAFRPGPVEIKLDLQLSLYSYALKHGVPACENCRPQYTVEGTLSYAGPCKSCAAKIGTRNWPSLVAERVELVWMRDFLIRQRDQFTKMIDDPEGGKEYYAPTRRMRKKQIINPKWVDGYKKGDQVGPGRILASRSAEFLSVHVADLVRLAGMIRDGRFFRKAGDHCNRWCKFQEPCLSMLETEVDDIDAATLAENVGTANPFED